VLCYADLTDVDRDTCTVTAPLVTV